MKDSKINISIFEYVVRYIQEHGYSPTVREICDGCNMKSTNTAHNHLKDMIAKGMLETDAGIGSPRAIRVPGYKFVRVNNENSCV